MAKHKSVGVKEVTAAMKETGLLPPDPAPKRVRIHFTGPTLVRGCAGNPSEVEGEQVGQWVYFRGEQASAPRLRMHVASGGFFLEDLPEPTE